MGQLIVRNLKPSVVHALKRRAARHGRSAEAEHRAILEEALRAEVNQRDFKHFLLAMPRVGRDSDFEAPRDMPREVEG